MNDDDPKVKNFDVGYGRPPISSRFRKGKSGNPAGSSKRVRNREESMDQKMAKRVELELNEKITVTVKGKIEVGPRYHFAAKAAVHRAMTNDKSIKHVLDLTKALHIGRRKRIAPWPLRRAL